MKIMKLTCSLAFALAVALASTGCHSHKPGGITPLPGPNPGMVGELPPGGTMRSESGWRRADSKLGRV